MWGYWEDYPKEYRNGQDWAVVNGRLFSRHACQHMVPSYLRQAGVKEEGYGVAPSYIEDVIRYGTPYDEPDGKIRYEYQDHKVVVNNFGAVVTIMNKHTK